MIESLPPARLEQVFAHPSTTAERPSPYERLEFLGDSLLGFVIAEFLYERYAGYAEGDLTRVRASVVSRRTCATVGRRLGLDERLAALHPGEKLSGSDNVVAAVVEVAIACCYLEFGLDAARAGILDAFAESVELAVVAPSDYKTQLQEELARRSQTVTYSLIAEEGPAHERLFTCVALVDAVRVGTGRGRSKKDAEQEAAKEVLEALASTKAV